MSTPVALSPVGNGYQFTGLAGQVLSAGFLYVYEAGTSTPEWTFTDNPGTIQNSNPIVLDASGHAPHEIWFENGIAYKIVSTDSLGNVQYTFDNLVGINDPLLGPSYASGPVTEATASGGQTVFSTFNYTPGFHGIMVFKNGLNLNSTQYTESSGNTITLTSPAAGGDVIRVVGIVIGTPGEDGLQGPTGATGANGLTWRGQWDPLTIYQTNDGVTNAGSSYIAIGASIGVPPPNVTYWSLMSQVGGTILPSGMITIPETVFTATAGQTVFDLTFPYVVGENTILVFLNGSKLSIPAYTESSATQITLASGAQLNDELVVVGQATGFTGPTGPTGSTGPTGATGPSGSAATIAVGAVTTGAPGSSAAVVNSGSTSAATFDFTIPRGDPGNLSGPAGAIDGNVAVFDGATGTLIKDGGTLGTAAFTAASAYQPAGTYVTSVTASGVMSSSGGTTPAITLTGTVPIANGGTNGTSFTAPSGNVNPLIFFDGTRLNNDTVITHVGYNTSTNTLTTLNTSVSGMATFNSKTVGFQSIATTGGTTTFTIASPLYTIFTGTQGQTLVLPNATTLAVGQQYNIDNDSTQAITVNRNGGSGLWSIAPGCDLYVTLSNNGTAAGTWETDYQGAKSASGTSLTISNTLTLAGTNGTTITAPSTTSTLARSPTVTRITATAGQTAFTVGTYQTGNGSMLVFVNGALMILTDDYAETNTTTITMASGLTLNDRFVSISF